MTNHEFLESLDVPEHGPGSMVTIPLDYYDRLVKDRFTLRSIYSFITSGQDYMGFTDAVKILFGIKEDKDA